MTDEDATKESPLELYSSSLDSKASGNGSRLQGVAVNQETKTLATAAFFGRHYHEFAVIVWDLESKRQLLEFYAEDSDLQFLGYSGWGELDVRISFEKDGKILEICRENKAIELDIDPDSWRRQACKVAGRNLSRIEWSAFLGDMVYEETCPELKGQ